MRRLVVFLVLLVSALCAAPLRPPITRFSVVVHNEFGASQGSGVLVEQGVLTAYHVIDLEPEDAGGMPVAPVLRCTLADGREFQARPLRSVPGADLALLSCDLHVERAELGDQPEQGAPVVIVGSGFHYEHSIKQGIVANLDDGDLLLDARVGPGDSGCAVLSEDEQLVGMVRAVGLVPPFVGYGIAVDADTLRAFLEQAP